MSICSNSRIRLTHLKTNASHLNASQDDPLSSNLARAGSPMEHTPPWFALFFMFFQTIQRASCLLTRSWSLIIFPWRTSKQLFRLSYHVTNCMQVYSSISRSVLAEGCLVWIVGKSSLEFFVRKLCCEFCVGRLPGKKSYGFMSYKLDLQLWKDFVIVKCGCKNRSKNFSHVCRNPIPIFRLIWAHPMMQHWDISSERHFSSGYLNLPWPGNRTNTHILHFLNFPFQLSYRTKYYFSSRRPQKSLKTFMSVVRLYHHRSEMNEQERASVEWLYQTRLTSIWRKRAISAQLGLAPTPKSLTREKPLSTSEFLLLGCFDWMGTRLGSLCWACKFATLQWCCYVFLPFDSIFILLPQLSEWRKHWTG